MIKYIVIIFFILQINLFPQGYICAVGGGGEDRNDWSDAPYGWIVQKADSGKVIVISVNTETEWIPEYFMDLGADTAYNLTIGSFAAANLQATYDELITAKAVFIKGGDQWNYIRLWKGTKTEEALKYIFNNGGVIAGTSAGAAVLGEVDFSAKNGSVYPDESLINPFNNNMQFESSFLSLVPGVIFDTHFIARGREARLISMLYNRHIVTGQELIGIGIDDLTAVGIYPDGTAEVFGSGAAAFFYSDQETQYTPYNNGKYTIEKLLCHQLTKGWKFHLPSKQISFIPPSAKQIDANREWELPLTDLYLSGSANIPEQLIENFTRFAEKNSGGLFGVITHPGYENKLDTLKNYLNAGGIAYQVISLNNVNLNDTAIVNKILTSTCFVFAGDSVNVISLLNDTTKIAGQVFNAKITAGTDAFFFGYTGKSAGEYYIDNLYKDMYASYRGKMTNKKGLNLFGDLIFEPSVYYSDDYYENTVSSVLWGMMLNRKKLGIYQHGNSMAFVDAEKKSITGSGTIKPLFVDASKTTYVDSSTYRASGSAGTRQLVAMNYLRYSYTSNSYEYMIESGVFDYNTGLKEENIEVNKSFVLYQNYPNPFNPDTKIDFTLQTGSEVSIKIYDLLGRELKVLLNEYKQPGNYSVNFNGNALPSGVYFYKITSGGYSQTKSMVLLK